MSNPCKIIAEAGVNHNGSFETAIALIDAALATGADYVKFQTFKTEDLVTSGAQKAKYQNRTTGQAGSQYDMLKRLELPFEAFADLAKYCATARIGFLSTPFDVGSAQFLAGLGVEAMKVSSGDLTNLPFLRDLASFRLPIILSTGMATLAEVETAVEALETSGVAIDQITLLHCTTEYPAPMADVNLHAMLTIRQAFPGAIIGYSDHTEGIEIPVAAAALGAQVLEKHLTLDRTMEGPDHAASLGPDEFRSMTQAVRNVCVALGDGRKRPTAIEIENRAAARKSIVAAKPIRAGEAFTSDNLAIRRPGSGLSPAQWEQLLGSHAIRDFDIGDLIAIK